MDGLTIEKYLVNCKIFKGVYSRDTLSNINIKKESVIIINTDKAKNEGEHWVCLYFDGKGYGEYMDSFGFPPLHEEIKSFINKACYNNCLYLNTPIQSPIAITCGYYCIFYAQLKCLGYNLFEFIENFTNKNYLNDLFIQKFIDYEIFNSFK